MLATQPRLNCIFNQNLYNSKQDQAMKNECQSDHLVFTLEDDISDQVLKSKSDEEPSSGSSTVALWIKSLKENAAFDDASQEYHGYTGSSSDPDDLLLGAEANDLRKKHRTRKIPSLSRDSDSDSSNNRWHSWTGRRSFLNYTLPYDRSLDSDTSGLSSVTSVSSLLTARESDPEDVLKGLGFRGPSVLDKIPDRFIHTGTICDGVDSEQFLCTVQEGDCEDAMLMNSEVPPWVMARFDDIPGKFWNKKEDPPECTDAGEGAPLINEPPSSEAKEETPVHPPKSSKFGTYLEPVTEEAELSSQGSGKLSPVMNNASFESTRSTLKANSQDGPENIGKIPSLCDLWQTTEDECEMNSGPIRSKDHAYGIVSDDTGESIPASSIPKEVDIGYNGDWIDRNRDVIPVEPWVSAPTIATLQQTTTESIPVSPWNSTPAIADIHTSTAESIPAITSGQWCTSQTDSVPSLSAYFTDNDTPISEDHRESSEDKIEPTDNRCVEVTDKDKLVKVDENSCPQITKKVKSSSDAQSPKLSTLRIPTVTISEPGEKTRKISTVTAPDIDKLLPLVLPGKTKETNSVRNKTSEKKAAQFNLYASHEWATVGNKRQPQVQFSTKGKAKRKLLTRSRKTANTAITLSISRCRNAKQVSMSSETYFANIPCFSNIDVECSGSETVIKDEYGRLSSKKEECLGAASETSKTKHDGQWSSGINIEEKLDGLQNSLKGVKMYKAGIHLMQLASSVETVMCSENRSKKLQTRSSDRLLDSIQEELKHLEKYILRLQKQLKRIKKEGDIKEEVPEELHRRGSDFSDITRQLLQEQLKMFNSISSSAVSPTSTPSESREPSLCSETPDVLRHTDVMKLRKEMQQLRQDSVEQNASMKDEILGEVRSEIRKCFQEFLQAKSQ